MRFDANIWSTLCASGDQRTIAQLDSDFARPSQRLRAAERRLARS